MSHKTAESTLMRLCRRLGFERLAWSLRRLHCPVPSDALVLEVGSGGNPYFRSNVLIDAFEDTGQRHWAPLISDRPTVLGMVERLPFRDKAFDFVIASHVLEHSADPEAFLSELQRVARAGYIEVPDAFMERVIPYHDHRLEITVRDGRLVIRKKTSWCPDPELSELAEPRAKAIIGQSAIPRRPFDFHVRYYWTDSVSAIIVNPEADAKWEPEASSRGPRAQSLKARVNAKVLALARRLFSQHARNRSLQLDGLLACPTCRSSDVKLEKDTVTCQSCSARYPMQNGLPLMFAKTT